jgi:predicted PurR-regulated permease PerM
MATDFSLDADRRRVGWWLVAVVLLGAVGLFFYSFVDTFVLGLFVYYGARPINRRIRAAVDSPGIAATITLLFNRGPDAGVVRVYRRRRVRAIHERR